MRRAASRRRSFAAHGVEIKIGGNAMQGNGSIRSMLACCDGAADSLRDVLLLIARICVAAMFYLTVSKGSPTAAYLTFLGYPAPGAFSALAQLAEWIIVVTLVLGVATRVGALIAVAFILVASVTAHQYWHYPEAGQLVQATYLAKNFAALGGALLVFAVGAGRYSVDAKMLGKA
jgi:putative oxidoreductase